MSKKVGAGGRFDVFLDSGFYDRFLECFHFLYFCIKGHTSKQARKKRGVRGVTPPLMSGKCDGSWKITYCTWD